MFENNNESLRQRSHSLPISQKLSGKLVPKAVDGLAIKGEDVLQSDEYSFSNKQSDTTLHYKPVVRLVLRVSVGVYMVAKPPHLVEGGVTNLP